MYNETEIKNYLKKLRDVANKPEFTLFGQFWARKKRIDDLFCCIIGSFPDGYKKALKNKALRIDQYQSVAAFNRLSDVLKRPVLFFSAFYQYEIGEVNDLFNIIERDIIIDLEILDRDVPIEKEEE